MRYVLELYVFSHVCGYTCTYGCICVEAQGWYWKSSSVVLPLYSFKTGSLAEPGAHQSQQVSSQFAPEIPCLHLQRLELQAGYHVNLAFTWGSGHLNFPSSCLLARTSAAKPSSPAFSISGRIYLPKPETRRRPQLFILEVDFKETKRVTPGINSVSCPFIARLESRAWI